MLCSLFPADMAARYAGLDGSQAHNEATAERPVAVRRSQPQAKQPGKTERPPQNSSEEQLLQVLPANE